MQLQLAKRLFSSTARPEDDMPEELERLLAEFATEREQALEAIKQLVAPRTQALLDADDAAINKLDAENDRLHRQIERADLIAEQGTQRLAAARARVAAAQDCAKRAATAKALAQLADDLQHNAKKLAAALSRFGLAVSILERVGQGTAGTGGLVEHAIAMVNDAPAVANALRQRARACEAGGGPSEFVGLE